jgi:hypothetical protein
MKTPLPTSVKINSFKYAIDYVATSHEVDDDLLQADLLGQACHCRGHIRVLADQQPAGVLDTLIHELLHAVFSGNHLLSASIRPEIGDKPFVGALASALASLLIENKWVDMPTRVTPTVRRIIEANGTH